MGNQTSRTKTIFDKLDTNHTGTITLADIKNGVAKNEDLNLCSLTVFYVFDQNKKGCLTYKEFQAFMDHVASMQKNFKKSYKKKYKTKPAASQRVQTMFGKESMKVNTYRHGRSMSIQSPDPKKGDDDSNDIESYFISGVSELLHANIYENKEKREQFLNWLFKLVDRDSSTAVSVKELSSLLSAISFDDVNLHSLLFEPLNYKKLSDKEKKLSIHELLALKIMQEYDIGKDGLLTASEFRALGYLILTKYEQMQKYGYKHQKIGDWTLEHVIGEGAYGKVMYGSNHITGEVRAIKMVPKGQRAFFIQENEEVTAMKHLNHDNIVPLLESSEDDSFVYIHMPLCGGGSLYEHLENPFSEAEARFYFKQIIDGLSYCHSSNVCHRDLRIENLLLDNNGNLKITDFGQARMFSPGWDYFETSKVGSKYHLSPEQVRDVTYSGEKVDIWSTGVVLFILVTGEFPFCESDELLMNQKILKSEYTFPSSVSLSNPCQDLIRRMLTVNPDDRISIDAIKSHPWLSSTIVSPPELTHKQCLFSISSLPLSEESFSSIIRSIKSIFISHSFFVREVRSGSSRVISTPEGGFQTSLKCIEIVKDIKFLSCIRFNPPSTSSSSPCLDLYMDLVYGESKLFLKILKKRILPKLVSLYGSNLRLEDSHTRIS